MPKPSPESLKCLLSLLQRWPADPIRPGLQFSQIVGGRVQSLLKSAESGRDGSSYDDLKTAKDVKEQAKAAEMLLGDLVAEKFRVTDRTLRPASNPGYFQAIAEDLEQLGQRTWLDKQIIWLKGLVRWK